MSVDLSKITINKSNILKLIEDGWNEFHQYIGTLSEKQLTELKDAAGWTAKDHIIHLSAWEDSVTALLDKKSRAAALGVDESVWTQDDVDAVNAIVQKQHQNLSLEAVFSAFKQSHERLLGKINAMKDEDLLRPHRDFQTDSDSDRPIYHWIANNTFLHYEEHTPWIEAIVAS